MQCYPGHVMVRNDNSCGKYVSQDQYQILLPSFYSIAGARVVNRKPCIRINSSSAAYECAPVGVWLGSLMQASMGLGLLTQSKHSSSASPALQASKAGLALSSCPHSE